MRAFTIAKKVFGAAMLSLIALSFFGSVAYAAVPDCKKEYCALTTIPGLLDECKSDDKGNITCEKGTVKNPVDIIKKIYGISIGIGAILAVVMIIWAGVEYSTTEAITGKSDAKDKWQGALLGLGLLLASYIILRTINVDLVNINLDLGDPIKDENNRVEGNVLGKIKDSIDASAKRSLEATQTMEQRAKSALIAIQGTVKDLEEQLKDPTLSPSEKQSIQREIYYAKTIQSFRVSDQEIFAKIDTLTKSIGTGVALSTNSLKSVYDAEMSRLKNINVSKDDVKSKLAVEERIKDIEAKVKELPQVEKGVKQQLNIYNIAKSRFPNALPPSTTSTVEEFRRQMTVQVIAFGDGNAAPAKHIQKIVNEAPIKNPEIKGILETHGSMTVKAIDMIIDKRVACYESYKKDNRLPSGCAPFNN